MERIEDALKEDQNDQKLILLQLEYYEKLGWPEEAHGAIRRARQKLTLEPVIARKMADFYIQNDLHLEFLELRQALSREFVLPEWIERFSIEAFLRQGSAIRSKELLREYFQKRDTPDDHFWGGRQYLAAGDTVLGVYHLLQARQVLGQRQDFLAAFVPAAMAQGLDSAVVQGLEYYAQENEIPTELVGYFADAYVNMAQVTKAKNLLWANGNRQYLMRLSELYVQELKWDSAHYSLDVFLSQDPNDLELWLMKGRIDEQRGWLRRSLSHYTRVYEQDSTFSDVQELINVVSRKIAYLRRIREAQQDIPTINLESKKKIQ